MRMSSVVSLLAALVALVSLPVQAAAVTATITADNHYALYYGTESNLVFVGRNEKGPAGSSGPYNWSAPETYANLPLAETDRLFIVQWDEVTSGPSNQAWLGAFTTSDGGLLVTNTSEWGYFLTSTPNPGTNGDAPTADGLEAMLGAASWTAPGFSTPNGTDIWAWYTGGPTAGITTGANWISRTSGIDSTNFLTVYRSIPLSEIRGREIVTTPVPEPGTAALLALGTALLGTSLKRKRSAPAKDAPPFVSTWNRQVY